MTQRIFWILAMVLVAQAPLSAADKPNIIFIMVDDLGPEWIGCYGAEDIQTPHIDALATGGMRFENAYSMPKCTPTRVTLLTGQYPFRHGWVNHWDVPRWGAGCHFDPTHYTTFANLMKRAGYKTAIAGKWQINDFRVQPKILADHGFDEWCMWTGYETGNRPSGKRYWDPYIHTTDGKSKTYKGKFGPDVYTDFIVDFLGRHKDEPMMIYFPMALTHTPFVTTPDDRNAKSKLGKHKAMVRYTDKLVGRIAARLDELKIRKKTILIFSTDNGTVGGITGTLNGRKVKGGKGKLNETGCWAPFIVNGPGLVPAGRVTDALTDFTDLLPTFCELGGVEISGDLKIDGKSLAKVILGQDDKGPRDWIMAMGGGVAKQDKKGVRPARDYAPRVLRDRRFKIWVDGKGKAKQLFDLKADPAEKKNLINSAEGDAAAALKKLRAAVDRFPKTDARPKYDPTPPQKWDRGGKKRK